MTNRAELRTSGIGWVVAATCGLAFKGIWARLAYAAGADVTGVLYYRALLSSPLLLIVAVALWWRTRGQTRAPVAPPWRANRAAILLGILFSFCMLTDFQAIALAGAGLSRVILFGFPLVVMALDAIFAGQRPTRAQLAAFALAWSGLVLIAAPAIQAHDGSAGRGIAWAVAALLLYSIYTWASAGVARRLGSVRYTAVSNLSTAACIVGYGLVQGAGSPPAVSADALMWIAIMVAVSTVIPYFLMFEGMARVGATQASLAAMLGPVITLVSAWLILQETYTSKQVCGAALVMLAVASLKGLRLPKPWHTRRPPETGPSAGGG